LGFYGGIWTGILMCICLIQILF